jgi:hypothetical protein
MATGLAIGSGGLAFFNDLNWFRHQAVTQVLHSAI